MTTKTKVILAVVTTVAVAAGAYYFSVLGSECALFERFPDVDPKIVVKVHRQMLREALTAKDTYPTVLTDADYDRIFLEKVAKLTSK